MKSNRCWDRSWRNSSVFMIIHDNLINIPHISYERIARTHKGTELFRRKFENIEQYATRWNQTLQNLKVPLYVFWSNERKLLKTPNWSYWFATKKFSDSPRLSIREITNPREIKHGIELDFSYLNTPKAPSLRSPKENVHHVSRSSLLSISERQTFIS